MQKHYLLSLPPNRVRRNYKGGAVLDVLEGKPNPFDGDRPEDWIASTTEAKNPGLKTVPEEGLSSVLADGKMELLANLFRNNPIHYLGEKHFEAMGTELGFLAKLLDSSMRLHVQAHPTAEFAQKYLNSRWGKLETYVILGVRDGFDGYIRLGFQRPPTPDEWKRIVYQQDIAAMDACFDQIPVSAGEVWMVPGGLPHAIGEGLLVLEVMEPTDLVVRCEFEREGIIVPPQARFMQKDPDFAMQIFDYTSMSAEKVRRRYHINPQVMSTDSAFTRERLICPSQTDCFRIERFLVHETTNVPAIGSLAVGIVTGGQGTVTVDGKSLAVSYGTRFLTAATAKDIQFKPNAQSEEQLTIILCLPVL